MNVVTLIGNLATEVELREVAPDKRVASFVLVVDRASRDGQAAERSRGRPAGRVPRRRASA